LASRNSQLLQQPLRVDQRDAPQLARVFDQLGLRRHRLPAEVYRWQAAPFGGVRAGALVRGNNCFNASGTWRTIGAGTCDHGTQTYLAGPTVECANVFVLPDGNTRSSCRSQDVIRTLDTKAEWGRYCVNWRYVTRDRQWVMVRDPRTLNRGGWAYIKLTALDADRGRWPAYDERGTCPPN